MRSIREIFKRLLNPHLASYDNTSLTESFNKLAQSPFGRQAIAFCKDQGYSIHTTTDLGKNILGQCDGEDKKITVLPNADFGTMAHEMRHAFQFSRLGAFADGYNNPFYKHMQVRLTEADAFTFSMLVTLSRWQALGVKADDITASTEPDADTLELRAYRAYANNNYDPQVLLEILRGIFDYYYFTIASLPGQLHEHYEKSGMSIAEKSYLKLYEALKPPESSMQTANRALMGKRWNAMVDDWVQEYRNTGPLLDGLASRLGQVPGLAGNYLTQSRGNPLSHAFYTQAGMNNVIAFHAVWNGKIESEIKNRHLRAG